MLIAVIGGSGSGKSEFAENMAVDIREKKNKNNNKKDNKKDNRLIYLAAMHPFGQEGAERIKRHREARKDKSFITEERYTGLGYMDVLPGDTILLECMSNLLANEMFDIDGAKDMAVKEISDGIERLMKYDCDVIIVTNDIFCDGETYSEETEKYIKNLAEINKYIFSAADEAYEVVCGIPVKLKGEKKC